MYLIFEYFVWPSFLLERETETKLIFMVTVNFIWTLSSDNENIHISIFPLHLWHMRYETKNINSRNDKMRCEREDKQSLLFFFFF